MGYTIFRHTQVAFFPYAKWILTDAEIQLIELQLWEAPQSIPFFQKKWVAKFEPVANQLGYVNGDAVIGKVDT